MILQSLVTYYEALEKKGEITRPGWCLAKVSFALALTREGELSGVIPLKQEVQNGKKMVMAAQMLKVPEMPSRSSGVMASFLCDNSSYLLGIDNKGKPERSLNCFKSSKEKHLEVLEGADSPIAGAVKNYFKHWNAENALEHPALTKYSEEIMAGANLIFCLDADYAQEDKAVREAWENYRTRTEDAAEGICLVTGERTEIARIHGAVKGVQGAQSSGALLVSFNAPAFESYGKEQSFNAPVGVYATYAYTTVLNRLLADRKHMTTIGDAAVVYWSEDGEEVYQEVFAAMAEPRVENWEMIHGVFQNLQAGKAVVSEKVLSGISLDKRFYILGLAPNAARLSVRFFYQDSFGNILRHIQEHYNRMEIVRPAKDEIEYLGIWRMLQETVNQKSRDKKPIPNMAGSVFRAMISGGCYPASLYQAVIGRVRAQQDDKDSHSYKITRGRAAIIKAYLLRNGVYKKEDITVGLNEDSKHTAYTLGREFAVLEAIQEEANPGINATIKDRYFNAACATPASIFPILFKLKNSHIRKFNQKAKEVYYEKLLGSLQDKLTVEDGQQGACPKRLSLEEQGMFILGYYHQTQKRFEKKSKEEAENGGDN